MKSKHYFYLILLDMGISDSLIQEYTRHVWYNLKVSHCHHVCNFNIQRIINMYWVCWYAYDLTKFPVINCLTWKQEETFTLLGSGSHWDNFTGSVGLLPILTLLCSVTSVSRCKWDCQFDICVECVGTLRMSFGNHYEAFLDLHWL